MVGAADGTGHNAEYGFRGGGQNIAIGKEGGSQHGSHACILHAYLYGERTFLGCAEVA